MTDFTKQEHLSLVTTRRHHQLDVYPLWLQYRSFSMRTNTTAVHYSEWHEGARLPYGGGGGGGVPPAKGCSALSSKSYDRRACYVSHMRTRAELLSQIARSARNQHWTSAASTGRHGLISRNELRQSLTLETPVTMKANRSREATRLANRSTHPQPSVEQFGEWHRSVETGDTVCVEVPCRSNRASRPTRPLQAAIEHR